MKHSLKCKMCNRGFLHSQPHARYCRSECRALADRLDSRDRYRRNGVAVNTDRQRETTRLRWKRRWQIILNAFGDACQRCKKRYPCVVYDLHHRDGKKNRRDTPSKIIRGGSERRFLAMLNEVDLLCANCHRLHHAEIQNWAPRRLPKIVGKCKVCGGDIVTNSPVPRVTCGPICSKKHKIGITKHWKRKHKALCPTGP
jgi:hypothetical protein